jgi:hypothetical protein
MQRRFLFFLCAVAASLAACTEHGSLGSSAPGGAIAVPQVVRTSQPQLFVADAAQNAVDAFAPNANGDVAPTGTISGADTGLSSPHGVAVGNDGSIYVSNDGAPASVTVYAGGATGDAVPVRTITCGGLADPAGMSLDSSGDLLVANTDGKSVSIFRPTDEGCVSGNLILHGPNTCIVTPRDVDLTADGHIVVASSSAILIYKPGASGDATPVQKITGPSTGLLPQVWGVDVDSGGNIDATSWSTTSPGRITVYAASANGDAAPLYTIAGKSTTLKAVRHIETDSAGDIWVSNGAAIDVFAPGASGDVAPSQIISGSLTGLVEPLGLDLTIAGL